MAGWVKVQLLKKYPDIIAKRGANIGGFKQFKDFDNDGIVGNPKDFTLFYRKHKAAIDKYVPFFKQASAIGVSNHLIEALSIESSIVSAQQIKAAFVFFMGALTAAKNARTAEDLFKVLVQKKVRVTTGTGLISEGIANLAKKNGGLTSDAVNLMVMGLAIALKLRKVRLALLPSATRIKEGSDYFMIESGTYVRKEKTRRLSRDYLLPPRTNVYLQGLSNKQLRGHVHHHYGMYYSRKKNYLTARNLFTLAHSFHPTHVGTLRGLGTANFYLRDIASAKAYLSRAIALDPRDELSYYMRAQVWLAYRNRKRTQMDLRRACKLPNVRRRPVNSRCKLIPRRPNRP